jgi:phosphoribosylformimino-5-aminoimidazole carboxamide ribotide isomerase
MLIIPAIDLLKGRCVRLIQGDYSRERTYDADPVETARQFLEQGAQIIHVVDLDGAKGGEPGNWEVIAALAEVVPIEVGGGVRSLATARRLLDMGVRRVVVGTKLVQDAALAAEFFQLGEQVVAGIDARNGFVATHGWQQASSTSARDLAVKVERLGCRRIILTDIARDGMFSGPNCELFVDVAGAVSIPVISSGGIGGTDDVLKLAALDPAPEGVIIGRAIYEGRLSVKESIVAINNS